MTGTDTNSAGGTATPVRVMLIISNLEYGGAQRQVVELANHLDGREFEVHVCSLSPYVPLAAELRRPDRLHVVTKYAKFDVTVVPRLARLLRRLQIDVAQSYLFDADVATCLAGRCVRTPVIAGSERNANYVLKQRQLIAYRLTRSCVDVVVANSNAGAEFHRGVVGHPASRYRVVHNGVDAGRFLPLDPAPARASLGIAPDERVVGIFASFKPQKNHGLFFRAAARLVREFPTVRLLLVGDQLYGGMHGSDVYKDEMLALVKELGLLDRCIFTGNRTDLPHLYAACDLTVLSSLFEGTPNAVLESLACGVPVVTTDVSDAAEIVPHGRVGFVVPLGDDKQMADRMAELLRDDALRRAMGGRARQWAVERFSTERLVARTAEIYREALRTSCRHVVHDRCEPLQETH